ncbi:MAG: tetratricopeptide repeat protein [Alphaproteobacteria bacterium]|nr:tetratricopeptide repeat protein [Alphaproteobacteria bacterium]
MTQSNLIQEIDEDLQRKRIEKLWREHGPYVIAAAVILVLSTAVGVFWRTHRADVEQKATVELISIVEEGGADRAKQAEALEKFTKENKGESQAIFAKLYAAARAAKEGDNDKAVALYESLSGDEKVEPLFRQLADLLIVQVKFEDKDIAALQARLQPLLNPESAWFFSAKEYSAHLALRAGDKEKAKQMFTELSQETGAPVALAARAGDMLRIVDAK